MASANGPQQAVLYARVSSKDQAEGFSIIAQQKTLRQYAREHSLTIVHEFEDVETAKQVGRTGFGKMLAWVTLGLTIGLILLGLWKGLGFFDILVTSVAIAVAAIPEGLLISLTVILAVGMQRLLHVCAPNQQASPSYIACSWLWLGEGLAPRRFFLVGRRKEMR